MRNDIVGLRETADSILAQNSEDYEWIVIDGDSTDGCVSFLESASIKCLHWRSEPDTGIYQAMNKGVALAKGAYLVFLNAGDWFPEDKTLDCVKTQLTSADQTVDALFGGAMLMLQSGKSVYRGPKELSSYIWHGLPSIHQATYYRREILEAAPYDETYEITGDYDLMARLYVLGISSKTLNRAVVNFRVGDTSYRKPLQLLIEANRVQRDVLKLGRYRRVFSLARKVITIIAYRLLAWNCIPDIVMRMMSPPKQNE